MVLVQIRSTDPDCLLRCPSFASPTTVTLSLLHKMILVSVSEPEKRILEKALCTRGGRKGSLCVPGGGPYPGEGVPNAQLSIMSNMFIIMLLIFYEYFMNFFLHYRTENKLKSAIILDVLRTGSLLLRPDFGRTKHVASLEPTRQQQTIIGRHQIIQLTFPKISPWGNLDHERNPRTVGSDIQHRTVFPIWILFSLIGYLQMLTNSREVRGRRWQNQIESKPPKNTKALRRDSFGKDFSKFSYLLPQSFTNNFRSEVYVNVGGFRLLFRSYLLPRSQQSFNRSMGLMSLSTNSF